MFILCLIDRKPREAEKIISCRADMRSRRSKPQLSRLLEKPGVVRYRPMNSLLSQRVGEQLSTVAERSALKAAVKL